MLKGKPAKRNAPPRGVAQRTPCVDSPTPKRIRKPAVAQKLSAPKAKAPSGYKYRTYHHRAVEIYCSNPSFNTHDVHEQLVKEGADVSWRCIDAWSKKYLWADLREQKALSKQGLLQKANDILSKPNANSQDVFAAAKLLEQIDVLDHSIDNLACPEGGIDAKLQFIINLYSQKMVKEKHPAVVNLHLSIIQSAQKMLQQNSQFLYDLTAKTAKEILVCIEEHAKKYDLPLLEEYVAHIDDLADLINSILLFPHEANR